MSASPYFKQIESLRFIAVFGVIFSHNISNFFGKDVLGRWGVDTFFVISGFLITRILLDSKDKIESGSMTMAKAFKTFYARRILRIFPLFYVKIAIIWFFHNHYIHNTRCGGTRLFYPIFGISKRAIGAITRRVCGQLRSKNSFIFFGRLLFC